MTQNEYIQEIQSKYQITEEKKNIFIVGSPNHNNLGDHAIWYATDKLLHQLYPQYNIVDVSIEDIQTDFEGLSELVSVGDIFILQGGGNFGNLYMDDEIIRRMIIMIFPRNRKIMFPQTYCFTDDADGVEELQNSVRIYGADRNLVMIARDNESYLKMKDLFSNEIFLLPDVVLTVDMGNISGVKRSGALLCFRNDAEKKLSTEEEKDISSRIVQRYGNIKELDTVTQETITKDNRISLMQEVINEFAQAELVVTDRLHGMIFSIITNTPCLVLPNSYGKVINTCHYLQNEIGGVCIELLEDIQDFDDKLNELEKKESKNCRIEVTASYKKVLGKCFNKELVCSDVQIGEDDVWQCLGHWDRNHYELKKWHELLKQSKCELEKWHEQLKESYNNCDEKRRALEHDCFKYQDEIRQLKNELVETRIDRYSYEETKESLRQVEKQLAELQNIQKSRKYLLKQLIKELI